MWHRTADVVAAELGRFSLWEEDTDTCRDTAVRATSVAEDLRRCCFQLRGVTYGKSLDSVVVAVAAIDPMPLP